MMHAAAQIDMNVHYIDDVVVKSMKNYDLLVDLDETFFNLQRFRMMLNPEKCTFGVSSGKLLSFIVLG